MPDFTLRHPDTGDESVVGNASDRARLLSQGYHDVTDEPDEPAATPAAVDPVEDTQQPAPASTPDTAPVDARPETKTTAPKPGARMAKPAESGGTDTK